MAHETKMELLADHLFNQLSKLDTLDFKTKEGIEKAQAVVAVSRTMVQVAETIIEAAKLEEVHFSNVLAWEKARPNLSDRVDKPISSMFKKNKELGM